MTQFIVLNICIPKSSEAHTRGLHSKVALNLKLKKNRVLLALRVKWVERNDEMVNF